MATNGSVSIDTTTKKYGSGAGSFGVGNYLTLPDGVFDFNATEDFTIELWAYATGIGPFFPTVFANYSTYNSGATALFAAATTDRWQFMYRGTFAPNVYSDYAVQLNEWTHLAIVRRSGTVTMYVNGAAQSATASHAAASIGTGSQNFIGAAGDAPNDTNFLGRIDDFRVVRGLAVYQSDFLPPTSQLSVNANVAPPAPYGTFLFSTCINNNLTGFYANGTGGRYAETISAGSCS